MLAPVTASFRPKTGGRARISVGAVAQALGYSRQAVYKQQRDAAWKKAKAQAVKQLVADQRKLLPRVGTRKLHYLIAPQLKQQQLKMGRDGLFALLRDHGLLIHLRRRYVQTTMSRHWMRKWPNRVRERTVSRPDEVWVSDITYLKTEEGTMYLNLVTDAFSRKIVGYALAENMETSSMIVALHAALAQRPIRSCPPFITRIAVCSIAARNTCSSALKIRCCCQ